MRKLIPEVATMTMWEIFLKEETDLPYQYADIVPLYHYYFFFLPFLPSLQTLAKSFPLILSLYKGYKYLSHAFLIHTHFSNNSLAI